MNEKMMRKCVITDKFKVEVQAQKISDIQPDWVLARVESVGICGTDVEMFTGDQTYIKSGLMHYPIVPGHEWVGRVASVGNQVNDYAVGDRITGETHIGCGTCEPCLSGKYNACKTLLRVGIGGLPGACGDYILLPSKSLHHLPENISTQEAILLEPATVVHSALVSAGFQGGERVAIYGPGTLGLLGISIARSLGASEIILIGTRDSRLSIGKNLGADETINITTNPDGANKLRDYADVVLETSGSPAGFIAGLGALRKHGRLCIVSLYSSPASLDLSRIVVANLKISGNLGSPGIWDKTIRLMTGRRILTEGIVTHTFPLDRVAEAFETAHSRTGNAIKVSIKMD